MIYKAKVAQYKKDEVNRIKDLLQKYKVIAIADMTSMPSLQLQKLRASIKDSVIITMTKGRLIKRAIEDLKGEIKSLGDLEGYIRGMPALLFTNDNPFKLAKILRKSKSIAPAKAGQVAPNDIIIPAGPTSLLPGPVIGELGAIGVKAKIEEGKIAIQSDKVVTREGEVVTPEVASVLSRLGIEPMEIGINLQAAYENGVIFKKSVLEVDEKEFLNQLKLAASNAFNLTLGIFYLTKHNIKLLLIRGYKEANALTGSQNIITSENVNNVINKANLQAETLNSKLDLSMVGDEEKEDEKISIEPPRIAEYPRDDDKPSMSIETAGSYEEKKALVKKIIEKQDVQPKVREEPSPTPEPHPIPPREPIQPYKPEPVKQEKDEVARIFEQLQEVKLKQTKVIEPTKADLEKQKEEEFKKQEAAAKAVLDKLQDEKISKLPRIKTKSKPGNLNEASKVFQKLTEEKINKLEKEIEQKPKTNEEKKFKEEEKKAQEVLKKLQEEKIEKEDREKSKPRGF